MTFDQQIHYLQLITEAVLSMLFVMAFLGDVIPGLNPMSALFTMSLVLVLGCAGYFVTLL